jgi:predicted dehydrogenase
MIESFEIKDIVTTAIEYRPPRVDPADALYALKAVEAVEKSIEREQAVNV